MKYFSGKPEKYGLLSRKHGVPEGSKRQAHDLPGSPLEKLRLPARVLKKYLAA